MLNLNLPTPLHIVLHEPDIPPNTGNIARLCAGTGCILHLIEPLGFRLTSQAMKRAGLDYWDAVEMHRHTNIDVFFETCQPEHFFLLSTKGEKSCFDVKYPPGSALIFGSETRGLPDDLLAEHGDNVLSIPMKENAIRSINLSNSVAIVLYEAIRQIAC